MWTRNDQDAADDERLRGLQDVAESQGKCPRILPRSRTVCGVPSPCPLHTFALNTERWS